MKDLPPDIDMRITLGRILEKVSSTDANVARLVWRADNIESRVEALEQKQAQQDKPPSVGDQAWQWAARAAVVIIIGYIAFQLGLA